MIHLELQPEIEAQIAVEAQARGLTIENPLEDLLTAHVQNRTPSHSAAQAVAAIRELRKGLSLDGLSISDLIQEGRRL
jgi:hypothetical protein